MTVGIAGSRVLLTGASGGLGQAIARTLRAKGAHLVLTGRRLEVLEPLANDVDGTAIAADLSTPEGVGSVLAGAGEIDILIANAGIDCIGKIADLTVAEIDEALDVNLRTPILLANSLLPQMVSRARGHLVFIGSVASLLASPGGGMYSATKFGLRGLSAALRQELEGSGVSASIVMPGVVRDVGMAVENGLANILPPGTRTVTSEDVAKGVVEAISRDRGEVVVAPREQRVGAAIGQVFPEFNAAVLRLTGAHKIADRLT